MYTHLLDKVKKVRPEWKRSLIKNTLLMVALLLEEKTCNLWKLKGAVGKLLGNTGSDPRSHYQRLKRWLWLAAADRTIWVEMLKAATSLLTGKSLCLILDGSSWKWGGRKYHFLTLSVLYRGVSIPIFWLELNQLGISSQWHRKKLLQLALKLFELSGKVLLADREYIGLEWFKTLHAAAIDFVIRLRKGTYKQELEWSQVKVEKLENKARTQVGKVVWKSFCLNQQRYYYVLVAYRNRKGKIDFLRLISTVSPARAVRYYGYRYRIESMFLHLKSNGFDMESLHVSKAYKVRMMMAALVLAYSLAVCYGLKTYRYAIKKKKHGAAEMSVFRWGLDLWQNHLQSFALFLQQLLTFFKLWLKPKNDLLNHFVP